MGKNKLMLEELHNLEMLIKLHKQLIKLHKQAIVQRNQDSQDMNNFMEEEHKQAMLKLEEVCTLAMQGLRVLVSTHLKMEVVL